MLENSVNSGERVNKRQNSWMKMKILVELSLTKVCKTESDPMTILDESKSIHDDQDFNILNCYWSFLLYISILFILHCKYTTALP